MGNHSDHIVRGTEGTITVRLWCQDSFRDEVFDCCLELTPAGVVRSEYIELNKCHAEKTQIECLGENFISFFLKRKIEFY